MTQTKDDTRQGTLDSAGHAGQRGKRHEARQAPTRRPQRQQRGEGEQAILRHGRSSMVSDIHSAVTTKYNQIFLLTGQDGDITPGNKGQGLYFRDTCFLDQLELSLAGRPCISLLADAQYGNECRFELTNPDLTLADGRSLAKERLSVRRSYRLDHAITHTMALHNLDSQEAQIEVNIRVASHFTNMFVVRGAEPGKRGTLHHPAVNGDKLAFVYDGADGHRRTTTLTFSPPPERVEATGATYHLRLKPRQEQTLTITIALEEHTGDGRLVAEASARQTPSSQSAQHDAFDQRLSRVPHIATDNPLFERALDRSLRDIRMLATANGDDLYLAAGVPWYVALFGRDSCVSAFEMLAFQPELAKSTLEVLASYQGTKHDDFQDEEPGKILHELRVGEKANLHETPQIPYYGTVDATPWFLILLGEYVRWTGDLDLFHRLRGNAERALGWMDANAKGHLDGYLEYGTRSAKGLTNQGWKDSGNSIVNSDGTLAQAPIALVEAQAYAFAARHAFAGLLRLSGEDEQAQTLERQAADLQERFERDYWMKDQQYFALALQRDKRQARAVASNPGQALFTGIVDARKASSVALRLLSDDLFCGWGIRTLAASEAAYNPLDYQVGSVWPHDNALIALGLRRYGLLDEMERVFTGIFNAAANFAHYRLPEVFDGFSKDQYERPVHYPVACSPQAWAAGALPLLLTAALGLEPDAPNHQLRIQRPRLPAWLHWVTIAGLRVGAATVDLRYQRQDETTLVGVLKHEGDLEVLIEY